MTKKSILRRVWDRCVDTSHAAASLLHIIDADLKYIEETEAEIRRLRDERFEDYARRYATVCRLFDGRVDIRYDDDPSNTYPVFPQISKLRRLPEDA